MSKPDTPIAASEPASPDLAHGAGAAVDRPSPGAGPSAPRGLWRRLADALAGREPSAAEAVEPPADPAADYERRFAENTSENLFRGVFATRDDAQRSAPPTRPIGYDNPESAALYFGRMRHEQYDYPAMFWLQRALQSGARSIFDVGGHVGIKFYAFDRPLALPDDVRWLVCDVPAVVERGTLAAARRGASRRLAFTPRYEAVDGHDVLFASGALQYLPMTIGDWLAGVARLPRHLIVNTTPIHAEHDFFTLNSIGTAFCPYHVLAERPFVESLERLGYRMRDRWINPDKRMTLPDSPSHSLAHYSGFYFERDAAA